MVGITAIEAEGQQGRLDIRVPALFLAQEEEQALAPQAGLAELAGHDRRLVDQLGIHRAALLQQGRDTPLGRIGPAIGHGRLERDDQHIAGDRAPIQQFAQGRIDLARFARRQQRARILERPGNTQHGKQKARQQQGGGRTLGQHVQSFHFCVSSKNGIRARNMPRLPPASGVCLGAVGARPAGPGNQHRQKLRNCLVYHPCPPIQAKAFVIG